MRKYPFNLSKVSFNFGSILIALLLPTIILVSLPGAVLDLFILISFCTSSLILIITLENDNPLRVTFLPTVVLLLTTFRLLLSIATTKNIIANENVGSVIETVGDFVMGGNLLSGLIIFVIITVVQFMVVTKGGERVAEVSARFSLDAMPGKQMSIDGDLKSGIITGDQAKKMRDNLSTENKLFGSLDGAMKFIKGDSIAGIIISLVNLFGGIYVGINQYGLTLSESVTRFSVLTIGDGLVSQIPSLLLSMACGIYLTRIKSGSESANTFVKQVMSQIDKFWKNMAVISVIIMAMGLFNPSIMYACVPLAIALALLSFNLYLRHKRSGDVEEEEVYDGEDIEGSGLFATLSFKIGSNAFIPHINKNIKKIESRIWGLKIGKPSVTVNSQQEDDIEVYISGVSVYRYSYKTTEEKVVSIMDDGIFYNDQDVGNNISHITFYFMSRMLVGKYNLEYTHSVIEDLSQDSETIKKEVDAAMGLNKVHDIMKEMLGSPEFSLDRASFFESLLYWSKVESDSSNWFTRIRSQAKYEITSNILAATNHTIFAFVMSPQLVEKISDYVSGQNTDIDGLIALKKHIRGRVSQVIEANSCLPVFVVDPGQFAMVKMFFQQIISTIIICCTGDIFDEDLIKSSDVMDDYESSE